MAITVGVNSYISATDANTYFNGRLYADDWFSASPEDTGKALVMARRVIDQQQFTGEELARISCSHGRAQDSLVSIVRQCRKM